MKHNFKIKDKVFDYRYGWMLVKCIKEEQIITENSGKDLSINVYYYDFDNLKTLSFTEYTLDGITQERLKEEFEINSLGFFWDNNDHFECLYSKLIAIENDNFPYIYKTNRHCLFKYFSLTPPDLEY